MLRRRSRPSVLCIVIFNASVESIDKPCSDREIVCYTSTKLFLTLYMENRESRVKFAKRLAALHVGVRTISAITALRRPGEKERYPSMTGGWYLPTDRDFSDQTGRKDFELREV